MQTSFQINDPQNQEKNSDPHEPKAIFLGTPVIQDSEGQAALRNLPDLEEPP